jgi:hypothetical protein
MHSIHLLAFIRYAMFSVRLAFIMYAMFSVKYEIDFSRVRIVEKSAN